MMVQLSPTMLLSAACWTVCCNTQCSILAISHGWQVHLNQLANLAVL